MDRIVDIDSGSGFCFGVTAAIKKAEEELASGAELYCLGDIVHNSAEVCRLAQKGLKTISHKDLEVLEHGARVLLRAHGEPPATYFTARRRGVTVVDATCPVVLRLQERIKKDYEDAIAAGAELQIVIYGQPGHAEVNGLVGQTNGTAIVVRGTEELDRVDMTKDISLYSQTTKSLEGFREIIREIQSRKSDECVFKFHDSICRQVVGRVKGLEEFAANHDAVLFVAGEKSSNGTELFNHCKRVNPRTYLLSHPDQLKDEWFADAKRVGICGATSTPRWLMEKVAQKINLQGLKPKTE